MEVLLLRTTTHRKRNAFVGATEVTLSKLVERAFRRGRRNIWSARRANFEGVIVSEIDGDLFEGGLEVVQDLLVELRADPVGIEDGGERVGLMAPHKTIIFDYCFQRHPHIPISPYRNV